jgi:putative oxidoreductase
MDRSLAAYAPLPLRLVLGFGFLYHGWPKVFTGQGNQMFRGMLEGIGVPAPGIMAYAVGLAEVLAGVALLVGVFVAIASGLMIVNMLVAMFTVHLPHGFNFMNITGMGDAGPQFGMPGYEVNLLYIAGLLALALWGPGALSVGGSDQAGAHSESARAHAS